MELLGVIFYYHLGFDPAAPSRFVVFAAPRDCYGKFRMAIYSSETGRWTSMKSKWGSETSLADCPECVFSNGIVHMCSYDSLIHAVDIKGKAWRKI